METTDSLIEANTRFYRAFELFDIEEMNELWDKELAVTCIHPGWPLIQGRKEILQSWTNIFNNTMVMQFTITESSIKIEGEWGWIVCTESLRSVVNGKVNEEFSERLRLSNKRTKYIAGKELALDFIQGSPNKYFGAPGGVLFTKRSLLIKTNQKWLF